MTTRRTFLGSTLFAASAATLPHLALGPSPGRSGRLKTKHGIELFVKDTGGPGRAIVLTHAWPLNADIWDYQAAALSMAGYRVVTYDRRGFGRSDKPESGYRFDVFADDLAAVIEQTGVRDATIAVKVPTLVLHGTADLPVSFEQAKATAGGIAGSTLIAYEGASHGIVVTERNRVVKDLQAFLGA